MKSYISLFLVAAPAIEEIKKGLFVISKCLNLEGDETRLRELEKQQEVNIQLDYY